MTRVRGTTITVLLVSAAGCTPALAATVPGCANPANSALNQYCDSIPTTKGGRPPKVGDLALAATLPSRAATQIGRGSPLRQKLSRLPARAGARPTGPPQQGVAKASASGLSLGLWLVLIGLTAALTAAAVADRRRRRRRARFRSAQT
jgi:hypothetical protein